MYHWLPPDIKWRLSRASCNTDVTNGLFDSWIVSYIPHILRCIWSMAAGRLVNWGSNGQWVVVGRLWMHRFQAMENKFTLLCRSSIYMTTLTVIDIVQDFCKFFSSYKLCWARSITLCMPLSLMVIYLIFYLYMPEGIALPIKLDHVSYP